MAPFRRFGFPSGNRSLLQDFSDRVQKSWFHQLWKDVQFLKLQCTPDHHITTTMLDCCMMFLFMKYRVGFVQDVEEHTSSKKFNFCLIRPQNICQKVLGIIKIFFWQNWDEPLCSFWSAMAFALEPSNGCSFCPVSFLLLNHEHWP